MVISVTELMENDMFSELSEGQLKAKLDALESMIRAYTNNNFQNRAVRFCGKSFGSMVMDIARLSVSAIPVKSQLLG